MQSKTLLQLKGELLGRRQTLSGLQQNTQTTDYDLDEVSKDLIDRSDAEESWFNKERMSQHLKNELHQIEIALIKIEQGSFGICEECGDDIPVKRLRVQPDAALCLICQETLERELGPHHRMGKTSRNSSDEILH